MCVPTYIYIIYMFIYLFIYEEILHQRHATLEIAADVQLTNSQETQAPAISSRGTGHYLAVTRAWCPADLRTMFVRNRFFIPDVETPSASSAEAMDTLWHRIDSIFQWENKILDRCGATNTPHTDSSVRSDTSEYLYIYIHIYIYINICVYIYIYLFIRV